MALAIRGGVTSGASTSTTAGLCDRNLLGGGFGPVYKGVLEGGQEIAVKKLSLESRQGAREFLNEVRLLLKVQHRNLVSILGCCTSAGAGHKMLVYPSKPTSSKKFLKNGPDLFSRQAKTWKS